MIGRRRCLLLVAGVPLLACGAALPEPGPAPRASPPEREPTPSPAAAPAPEAASELERRVDELRRRFGGRGWTVIAEPPFAVIGDGTPTEVEGHCAGTIRWAVEHLEATYFERPPQPVVTIWLFETAQAYSRATSELFGDSPDTPYGYYSPSERALVMNIGTGGGTLVHEIVHPYIESDFPGCPAWFNEGLASLYEQSGERDGGIVGFTNWRLEGLQTALRAGTVPSFAELCASGDGFYSSDPGSNYGQARYLCFWLQEQGLLRTFYRRFRAGVPEDPTGYATLVGLVGPDMDVFRANWERFVLGLRFP